MTDAQQGWYLRHRDGVEHGPFQFADILEAAKLGNVAADTCVRHERQTLGEWVIASRVQAIAAVMKSVTPRPGPTRVTRAPSRTTATPRRSAASGATLGTASGASSSDVQAPGSANRPTTAGDATHPAGLGTSGEAIPVIHRRHEQGYPVPKSFGKACLAFFDLRFRVFVTPWIITILWSLAILGLLIGVGKLGYESFLQEELASSAELTAEESQGHWEFEPLADQPFLKTKLVLFFWQASLLCIGLLVVRVFCEAAVVLFRAATDLHELKSQTKP